MRAGRQGKLLGNLAFQSQPSEIKKKKIKEDRLSSTLGRNPIFTKEKEIADHVIKFAKLFYGVTPIQLRKIAYDFASINKIPNNFYTNTELAGKDWLYLFLKRNPILRLRQPEQNSFVQ